MQNALGEVLMGTLSDKNGQIKHQDERAVVRKSSAEFPNTLNKPDYEKKSPIVTLVICDASLLSRLRDCVAKFAFTICWEADIRWNS